MTEHGLNENSDNLVKQEFKVEHCPEVDCGGVMSSSGGCPYCVLCGYSKCQ